MAKKTHPPTRRANHPAFHTVVVGTDGSDTAAEAVRQATAVARTNGARLHVVTAYGARPGWDRDRSLVAMPDKLRWMASPGEAAERIARQAAADAQEAGVEVEYHSQLGDAADVILQVAREVDADLVVVGNKGMQGTKRLLTGSVPNSVSHRAPSNVLIVHTT
jgi:nucleotide-binding universal stress UspA family protein